MVIAHLSKGMAQESDGTLMRDDRRQVSFGLSGRQGISRNTPGLNNGARRRRAAGFQLGLSLMNVSWKARCRTSVCKEIVERFNFRKIRVAVEGLAERLLR